jgi:hypothetical protein
MATNTDELMRDSKLALDFKANSIDRSAATQRMVMAMNMDTIYALIDSLEKQMEKVRELSKLLDAQIGTPCEEIRHKQEIDKLKQEIILLKSKNG